MKPAAYRCLKCLYRWRGEPGPSNCPGCGSKYVVWENFKEWLPGGLRSPPQPDIEADIKGHRS